MLLRFRRDTTTQTHTHRAVRYVTVISGIALDDWNWIHNMRSIKNQLNAVGISVHCFDLVKHRQKWWTIIDKTHSAHLNVSTVKYLQQLISLRNMCRVYVFFLPARWGALVESTYLRVNFYNWLSGKVCTRCVRILNGKWDSWYLLLLLLLQMFTFLGLLQFI